MKNRLKTLIFSIIGRWFIQTLFFFNKINIQGEKNFLKLLSSNQPIMVCVWHGRLLFPSWYIRLKTTNLHAIASRHPDAEIMASILKHWGYSLLRGSTKKGGKKVIKKMNEIFQDGGIIAITNDGPRGPARIAKGGSIAIALKNHAKIITITGSCTKYWRMKSWDKFMLPQPFGKIQIVISETMEISENYNLDKEKVIISDFINKYQNIADDILRNKID